MKPPSKKLKSSYYADKELFQRVDKYLDDNIDKPVIDKEAMVDALLEKYVEYKRRNRSAFRAAVFKAYDTIDEMMLDEGRESADDDDPDQLTMDLDTDPADSTAISVDSTPKKTASSVPYIESVISMATSATIGGNNNRNTTTTGKSFELTLRHEDPAEKSSATAKNNTTELINISSDEDCNEEQYPKVSASNQCFKPLIEARQLIGHNPAITICSVNPKVPKLMKKKILRKRKLNNNVPSLLMTNVKYTATISIPDVTFQDFGGNEKVVEAVRGLLLHLDYCHIYNKIGVSPPRGFLLHGPPGCGKTLLAKAIAGELGVPLVKTAGPELVGGVSGESEQRIRDLFKQAKEQSPCIVFIDEIDVIFPPRESSRKDMERRIVAQIISSFDDLNESVDGDGIAVIGATNNPDLLDPALRRAGRFDREICLGIPDKNNRKLILQVLCRNMRISEDVSFDKLADLTPGYVGADLSALCTQAGIAAVTRVLTENEPTTESKPPEDKNEKAEEDGEKKEKSPEENDLKKSEQEGQGDVEILCSTFDKTKSSTGQDKEVDQAYILRREKLDNLHIEMCDILKALKSVQPSAKREGFATVPDISWNDIGSLKEVKEKLDISIMIPVKYPKLFERIGVRAPSGVLLFGPPGCGKTLVAKAVANEANINFISVKGPELLNMYVGESERAVRQCFQRARNSQPCVIFFDEIDALCPKRSDSTESSVSSRVVNQVLTEMDGVEDRQGVFLMAATNRPDMVDPAVLRPGRLDKLVYIGLPNAEDRVDILRAITKNGTKPQLGSDITLEEIGQNGKCARYSGADLAALVREASVLALTELIKSETSVDVVENADVNVAAKHFNQAFEQIKPSVSEVDHQRYELFHTLYGSVINK